MSMVAPCSDPSGGLQEGELGWKFLGTERQMLLNREHTPGISAYVIGEYCTVSTGHSLHSVLQMT